MKRKVLSSKKTETALISSKFLRTFHVVTNTHGERVVKTKPTLKGIVNYSTLDHTEEVKQKKLVARLGKEVLFVATKSRTHPLSSLKTHIQGLTAHVLVEAVSFTLECDKKRHDSKFFQDDYSFSAKALSILYETLNHFSESSVMTLQLTSQLRAKNSSNYEATRWRSVRATRQILHLN